MSKLLYFITKGFGVLHRSSYGDCKDVQICIDGCEDGYITLGQTTLKLEKGLCRADLSRLDDGIHEPILFTAEHSFKLEPFTKEGRKILPTPTADWVIRGMLARVEELENSISQIKNRLTSLEISVNGYGLVGSETDQGG